MQLSCESLAPPDDITVQTNTVEILHIDFRYQESLVSTGRVCRLDRDVAAEKS